jgi:hypothetical protein
LCSVFHHYLQPGGAWSEHVASHVARRDGGDARAEALDAECRAAALAQWKGLVSKLSVSQTANGAGNETLNETLALLETLLGGLSERLRGASAQNDPDAQRAELSVIANDLDVLRQVLSYRDVRSVLRDLIEQASAAENQAADD